MKCKANQSVIVQALNAVREKHHITQDQWSTKSGVPKSTLVRYLTSSLNMPNFPYVCAMLKCVGESIDDFYASIDQKIDTPADAMKLDAIPPALIDDIPVDTPEGKAAVQERMVVQTEYLQAQMALLREKEAVIELLEAKLEMAERIIDEKDRTISNIEDISKRRLQALQALCQAQ